MAETLRLRAFAPAKVNLFLHVGARDAAGLHPLAGLSAFADVGDELTLTLGGEPGLTITGPFAEGVPTGPENLIFRALDAFSRRTGADVSGAAWLLDKRLPPASGLGGGTSDAGAALRLARAAWARDLDDATLLEIAREVGADGPMCLFPRVAWTRGHGEILTPEPRLPPLHGVLVNPGVPVPTGAVFAAYDRGPAQAADLPAPPDDWSPSSVLAWLEDRRNDLEAPAAALAPSVNEALEALRHGGACPVRMSGSGATVFGLTSDAQGARRLADDLRARRPGWWIVSTVLHAADERVRPLPLG